MVTDFVIYVVYFFGIVVYTANSCGKIEERLGSFPANFSFGVATAAYQIEGGWNEDGRGPSIWDTFTQKNPALIDDGSNGNVAADSYNRFEEDLKALIELKVDFYRFSISWSRILPNGDISSLNPLGIDYYNKIIDKLIANGIQPMATMYHYDLPDELQKIGGLTNALFIDYFAQYAHVLYTHFGDRVHTWITFNEPYDYCIPGYGQAIYPPQIHFPGVADYICMDNTLKAHAKAYSLYKSSNFSKFHGKVGMTISSRYLFTKNNDTQAFQRGMKFMLDWLVHPIFSKTGGYPPIMVEEIGSNSLREKRAWSRLPTMTAEWRYAIKGSSDFIGLNYYTSRYVSEANPPNGENPSYERDARNKFETDPSWKRAKSTWLYCVPKGLEELLKYIRDEYENPEVIITENGWSDSGELEDNGRIDYLKTHIQAVLNAVSDGCNVSGYTVWSLIDNFEWLRGYTEKFGLYYVNFTSTEKKRIAKKSARFYKKIIADKIIPTTF